MFEDFKVQQKALLWLSVLSKNFHLFPKSLALHCFIDSKMFTEIDIPQQYMSCNLILFTTHFFYQESRKHTHGPWVKRYIQYFAFILLQNVVIY